MNRYSGFVFGILLLAAYGSAQGAFPLPRITITCPETALIGARDSEGWDGSGSFVSAALIGATVLELGSTPRLWCKYDKHQYPGEWTFSLHRDVPNSHPYCRVKSDERGFVCSMYRLSAPMPVPGQRRLPPPWPYSPYP